MLSKKSALEKGTQGEGCGFIAFLRPRTPVAPVPPHHTGEASDEPVPVTTIADRKECVISVKRD
jgi:hypothetical protein